MAKRVLGVCVILSDDVHAWRNEKKSGNAKGAKGGTVCATA